MYKKKKNKYLLLLLIQNTSLLLNRFTDQVRKVPFHFIKNYVDLNRDLRLSLITIFALLYQNNQIIKKDVYVFLFLKLKTVSYVLIQKSRHEKNIRRSQLGFCLSHTLQFLHVYSINFLVQQLPTIYVLNCSYSEYSTNTPIKFI